MLSKEVRGFIDMLRETKNQSKGLELTAERGLEDRRRIDEIMGAVSIPEGIIVETVDEQWGKGEFIRLEEHSNKRKEHIILFLHGGGFVNGSVRSRRQLCVGIAKQARMDAFSVEYRQWPEAVHPAALNDCLDAYRWLMKKGYQNENIHVFGESAGAMLTLTMLLYLKDHGEPLPKNACVFSPVSSQGLVLESHIAREERDPMISAMSVVPYYSESDFMSPYVSPRYGDFKGFPKLSIHVGSEEVLFDDSVLIETLCREAGVEVSLRIWEELFHVFPLFPCPETDEAIKEIGDFLAERV